MTPEPLFPNSDSSGLFGPLHDAHTVSQDFGALEGRLFQAGGCTLNLAGRQDRKEKKTMDTIYIKGLEIFAYHGVNPEEKHIILTNNI